jgi:tetratricopeptide (TPR) repeat protein
MDQCLLKRLARSLMATIVVAIVGVGATFAQQGKSPPVDTSMSAADALHTLASLGANQPGSLNRCPAQYRMTKEEVMDSQGRVIDVIRWKDLPYVHAYHITNVPRTFGDLHYGFKLHYHFGDDRDDARYTWDDGDRDAAACKVYLMLFETEDKANRYAAAVNRLIWENSPEMEAKRSAQFPLIAAQWRSAAVKPSMPDEAHVHQVLAENAVREKNFDKAIDEYEAALEIFPTWPDGQNNLAFLCGETGDYDCGVEHAQDYLELVPNAPDAEAVKDKIIIWKDKLNGNN